MRVTEKLVKSPEEEGVTLAYIRLTKDFEEIKEYVQHNIGCAIVYFYPVSEMFVHDNPKE